MSDGAATTCWWKDGRCKAAALMLLTVVAYLPALRGGFVWDDDAYVTQNPTLLSAAGLWQIWSDPVATPQYYPLVHTSYWIEQQLWGLNPVGYHLNNVLLHVACALLGLQVLRRLAVPGAWLAAAVFALHPVEVESVAWITERKNVLSGVFYLSALLVYLRFAGIGEPGGGERRTWPHYWLALLLFVCALLSKTVACTLPAVVVLLLWWKHGRVRWADVRPLLPLFALGLGLGLLTVWLEKHQVGASGVDWELSWIERCLIAGRVLWFYAGKLVWPQELVFIYPRWQVDASAVWQYVFPAAALAAAGMLWRLREQLGRGPLVAVLCFAGTLFPALGFFDVYPMRYSFVADHFQYLASFGLIALLAAGVARGAAHWRQPLVLMIFAAVVLPVFAVRTWSQAGQYHDLETLWQTTLDRNPDCWMAHNNLSSVLIQKGQIDEATAHALQSLSIRPDNVEARVNLGTALLQKDKIDEAITQFQKAEKLQPGSVEVHIDLGGAFLKKGRPEAAIVSFQKALRLRPGLAAAHYSLGVAKFQLGLVDEAVASYQKALAIRPDYVEAQYNLGFVLTQTGRLSEAVAHFQRAVELRPGFADAHFNLGNDLLQLGRMAEAADHFQRVLETNPDQIDSLNNLALVLATCPEASVRNGAKAIELAQRAARFTENKNAVILHTLAAAYAETGQYEQAAETALQAAGVAASQGDTAMAEAIKQERRIYQSGTPLRHMR